MPTLFDRLPLDIIKYVIGSYVENDYFARISINTLLAPADRNRFPLNKDAVKQLGLTLALTKMRITFRNSARLADPLVVAERKIVFLDFMQKNPLILQHHPAYRKLIKLRVEMLCHTNYFLYSKLPEITTAALINKGTQLLHFLEQTPFLYMLKPSWAIEKYSAINGKF